jgi:hypothetical protein
MEINKCAEMKLWTEIFNLDTSIYQSHLPKIQNSILNKIGKTSLDFEYFRINVVLLGVETRILKIG